MTILITGGAGFIGTHLATALKQKGHTVTLCDLKDRFTDYHYDNFKCIVCDISDVEAVTSLPKCEAIYHLAAQVGTLGALNDLNLDLKYNAEGTLNISQFAAKNNVKILVYTSSMAVYGSQDNAKETDLLLPVSPYGISKACGEHYIKYASNLNSSMRWVIYRIFNCYGPHQATKNLTQGLASIFLNQIYNGNKIEVKGSLNRYRDLIYIDDVISALLLPLQHDDMQGVYNTCSGQKTTLKILIESILEIANKSETVEIENIGAHHGDPYGVYGNNIQLCRWGWTPQTGLIDGLHQCWEALGNA